MSNKLLRVEVRPNGVLWKNALAEYEKLCERRDWIRQRVVNMVIEERLPVDAEESIWELFLFGTSNDDEQVERYLAVFRVRGDLDDPATLELRRSS
jgi:hypothetical protein